MMFLHMFWFFGFLSYLQLANSPKIIILEKITLICLVDATLLKMDPGIDSDGGEGTGL